MVAIPLALALFGNRKALKPAVWLAGGVLLFVLAMFAFDRTVGLPLLAGCGTKPSSLSPSANAPSTDARWANTPSARLLSFGVGTSGGADSTASVRLTLTGIAFKAFLERPALGWGHSNFDRAFDKHFNISIYKQGFIYQNQAHNKVLGELATKGVLGALAYLGLWVVLVWSIVHRRRPPREEILAYAVLGALTAYFVQNLFLFDTPATALQWTVLVAWVAGQEQPPNLRATAPGDRVPGRVVRLWSRWRNHRAVPRDLAGLGRVSAVTATVVALVLSVYFLNYRPYTAAETFREALSVFTPLGERLSLARQSFDNAPSPGSDLRIFMFEKLTMEWDGLAPQEKGLVAEFIAIEAKLGEKADPRNARLLMAALPVLQVTAGSPAALEELEPLVQRLGQLAPERRATIQILAKQELLMGNYREAIDIAEAFEARVPASAGNFEAIKRAALTGLEAEKANP